MSQAVRELEFHISPAAASSRPQVCTGNAGRRSTTRRATSPSSLTRVGPPVAAARSGIDPAGSAADLVAEEAEPSEDPEAHWSFGDCPVVLGRPHRGHLDGGRGGVVLHHESGVEERGPRTAGPGRHQGLVEAPVPSDQGATGAGSERYPEQVDPVAHRSQLHVRVEGPVTDELGRRPWSPRSAG